MDNHNEEKKQKILDQIGNYKVGSFTVSERPDSDRQTMKFQWQNKPNRDYWNASDMMFGGPSDVFDTLTKDIYVFWLRRYAQVVGDSHGEWTHQGSSEGILEENSPTTKYQQVDLGLVISRTESIISLTPNKHSNL